MEEGKLTLDKYGFHKEIDSPTTVLATTNPTWGVVFGYVLTKGQIPLRKELVDRYDLVFVFESVKGKNQKIRIRQKETC